MYSWQLKRDRASRHLKAIDDEVTALLDRCEDGITVQREQDRDLLKVTIRAPQHPSSNELALTIGDFIHNARSSLDHLVAYLVSMNSAAVTTTTQFPIFKTQDDWAKRGMRQAAGLPAASLQTIKSLQPYHRGELAESTPLWLLRELSNWDKHRMPAFGWLDVRVSEVEIIAPNLEPVSVDILSQHGPVVPGAILAVGTYRVTGPNPEVSVQPHLTMEIVFSESMAATAGLPVVPTLHAILRTLGEEVFPSFDPIPSPIHQWRTDGFAPNPDYKREL